MSDLDERAVDFEEEYGWSPDYGYDVGERMSESVSVMPEILELRKEFKKKFGNTRIFDDFYMCLVDKIVAHHIESMKEWQKLDKEIKKVEKNTRSYTEEEE